MKHWQYPAFTEQSLRCLDACKTCLAQGCKRCWHSKGKAKQWREKPSLKSRRLKHTARGKGCLWPPVLFWHAGLSRKMKFTYDLCLFSWHAPDLQSSADRGKQESKAGWVVCMQLVERSRQCFQCQQVVSAGAKPSSHELVVTPRKENMHLKTWMLSKKASAGWKSGGSRKESRPGG